MITHYVLDFMISDDLTHVALIRKNRPAWQAGKLNGIGGHIEHNEQPIDAMIREFYEETGCRVESFNWTRFALMTKPSTWTVHCYVCFSNSLDQLFSMTDERVEVHAIGLVMSSLWESMQPNLRYLIPMAMQVQDDKEFLAELVYPNHVSNGE